MNSFDPRRIPAVEARIMAACTRAERPRESVELIAVSKTRSLLSCEAAAAAGLPHLAENYVQEWDGKAKASVDWKDPVLWHFIGRLQSNKVKHLVGRTHRIHTVDRLKMLNTIDRLSTERSLVTDILLQVNIAGESQKGGCDPDELLSLAEHADALPGVALKGLMTIAPMTDSPEDVRPVFRELREHLGTLQTHLNSPEIRELSMGMTADMDVAIEEGATWIRVGTALFGPRS